MMRSTRSMGARALPRKSALNISRCPPRRKLRSRNCTPSSTKQVNFALLHVFGDQFAPRYKDICDKEQTSLTAFHPPSRYDDSVWKPIRKIREDLIDGD